MTVVLRREMLSGMEWGVETNPESNALGFSSTAPRAVEIQFMCAFVASSQCRQKVVSLGTFSNNAAVHTFLLRISR